MYKSIMVPIDFAHANDIQRGLNVACDLAQHYGAELCIVGVTATAPTFSARSPREMATKLDALAETLTDRHGIPVTTKTVISHDPAVDLEENLVTAAREMSADLVVMSSHKPGIIDIFFAPHSTTFAAHTELSVFIVR